VLAISLAEDQLTPASTLDRLCTELTGAQVERVHLHEHLDHFAWARTPEAVAQHVVAFVSRSSP
jgi:predicted alpha/beta hydrolase